MKTYVLNGINQLDFIEVPKPKLREGEVLVEVKAAGICGSDIPRIFETGTYHFPTIPGHEFAGVVCEVEDARYAEWLGKRVGVFPLIPCMKCQPCKEKQYEMCMHYDYLGSRRDGGFAEYVAVPVRNLIELPEEVSFEAAAMLEPACVGIHALGRVDMRKVHSATIFGPGTIGLLIAQWLRALNVRTVYLVGTNEKQRELALELGFECFYNSREVDAVSDILEVTEGIGTDLTIECTGLGSVLEQCLDLTKRGGEVLVVGNPHGDVDLPKAVYWKILRKQLHISGTWNSSFIPEDSEDDWRLALEAMVSGKLQPEKQITHKLDFEQLQSGLGMMRTKSAYFNKVMIVR